MNLTDTLFISIQKNKPLDASSARELAAHVERLLAPTPEVHRSSGVAPALPDLYALGRLAAGMGKSKPFTCGIINAKSGHCAENCAFCAQSSHYDTGAPVHPFVNEDTLIQRAEYLAGHGVNYMGVVTSGTGPTEEDFDRLCDSAQRLARTGIRLCASLGVLHGDQAIRLKQAGFTSYHHNLETAQSHYPNVCGTHKFSQRCDTLRQAKKAGLRVCSGGIFGVGESWGQRLELSDTLRELEVDSIPVNFLSPIKGTPLEHAPRLRPEEALAIVSFMRLLHPDRDIVICGGRSATLGRWENALFTCGANGLMVGDYLTTPGASLEADLDMLRTLRLDTAV